MYWSQRGDKADRAECQGPHSPISCLEVGWTQASALRLGYKALTFGMHPASSGSRWGFLVTRRMRSSRSGYVMTTSELIDASSFHFIFGRHYWASTLFQDLWKCVIEIKHFHSHLTINLQISFLEPSLWGDSRGNNYSQKYVRGVESETTQGNIMGQKL